MDTDHLFELNYAVTLFNHEAPLVLPLNPEMRLSVSCVLRGRSMRNRQSISQSLRGILSCGELYIVVASANCALFMYLHACIQCARICSVFDAVSVSEYLESWIRKHAMLTRRFGNRLVAGVSLPLLCQQPLYASPDPYSFRALAPSFDLGSYLQPESPPPQVLEQRETMKKCLASIGVDVG